MKTLNEWESKRRLGDDLPCPREILAASREEAEQFAASIDGPIVAKASGVAHKTEGGLVRLGLGKPEIGSSFDELASAGDGTVLLAEQLNAELELIVGAYRDPSFGPLVTVGIGGIAAEIFKDLVAILAPPEEGEVAEALEQLQGRELLKGIRGGEPLDVKELSRIIGCVASLMASDENVSEIDCNPVMVCGGRPLVADALVVLEEG